MYVILLYYCNQFIHSQLKLRKYLSRKERHVVFANVTADATLTYMRNVRLGMTSFHL